MNFSEKEVKELAISAIALAVIFSLRELLAGGSWIAVIFSSLILISISLFVKMYSHKRVAEKYDCGAVYKFNYYLFIISLLIALITNGGIVFAALGSIIISSSLYTRLGHKFVNITQKESGLIALSGSMANVIAALVCLILYPLSNDFFQLGLNINIFMALFNMIPLPPLDGAKVLWWSRLVWFATFTIPLFLFFFGFNAFFSIVGIFLLILITFLLWQKMF
ncbi:MAG: hypothetical protein JW791_04545 [Nanoarchaeota archaeon]|nr:hypothetical protein [Nanoarchaeota archaeon]